MDAAVTVRTDKLVHLRTFAVGYYPDLHRLLDRVGRFKLGRHKVISIGAEFIRHHMSDHELADHETAWVSAWRTTAHVPINDVRAAIGARPLNIGHILGAYVELHDLLSEEKRSDFLGLEKSPKTGQEIGNDFERFAGTVGINTFDASQECLVTKDTVVVGSTYH